MGQWVGVYQLAHAETYCNEKKMALLERMTMGSRQYPSTLATQPYDTPEELIRFSKA